MHRSRALGVMDVLDRGTILRLEKIRILVDHNGRILELHQHRLVQAFAVLLGAGAAAVGSVLLDRVGPLPGLLLAGMMFSGAGWMHVQLRELPQRLKASTSQAVAAIDRLKDEEGE